MHMQAPITSSPALFLVIFSLNPLSADPVFFLY